jgi:hypothetical protein
MVGTSGWNDLKDPENQGKSLGFGEGFTSFLGTAEVAGSLGIMFGGPIQLAALGLIVIGLEAIQRKSAHRILGREGLRMALRPHVVGDESGHRVHGRRPLGAVAVGLSSRLA